MMSCCSRAVTAQSRIKVSERKLLAMAFCQPVTYLPLCQYVCTATAVATGVPLCISLQPTVPLLHCNLLRLFPVCGVTSAIIVHCLFKLSYCNKRSSITLGASLSSVARHVITIYVINNLMINSIAAALDESASAYGEWAEADRWRVCNEKGQR